MEKQTQGVTKYKQNQEQIRLYPRTMTTLPHFLKMKNGGLRDGWLSRTCHAIKRKRVWIPTTHIKCWVGVVAGL